MMNFSWLYIKKIAVIEHMRFIFFCAMFFVVQGQPQCICGPNTFYPTSSLTANLDGNNQYKFLECQSANPNHTVCTNGYTIGNTTNGITFQGTITKKCLKPGSTHSTLAQTTLTSFGLGHSSACCAACKPGYRLKQVVDQSGNFMGYVCNPQTCPGSLSGVVDTGKNPPQCKCNDQQFSSDFLPGDTGTNKDAQIMKASNNFVFSTEAAFSDQAGQARCLSYTAATCFQPENCKEHNHTECMDAKQPYATRCIACQPGYNKVSKLCTNSSVTWINITHELRNKCDECVLPTVGEAQGGCVGGNIVP